VHVGRNIGRVANGIIVNVQHHQPSSGGGGRCVEATQAASTNSFAGFGDGLNAPADRAEAGTGRPAAWCPCRLP
jgi:hypothetical protein